MNQETRGGSPLSANTTNPPHRIELPATTEVNSTTTTTTTTSTKGHETTGQEGDNANANADGAPDPDSDPDPLEIRRLALSYDYLIYKINDHISNLADTTYESIVAKQKLIEVNYLEDQLNLSQELTEIDQLLHQCNQLEMEFLKLDQLQSFINDFKHRIEAIEKGFQQLG